MGVVSYIVGYHFGAESAWRVAEAQYNACSWKDYDEAKGNHGNLPGGRG